MRAIEIDAFGDVDVLQTKEVTQPEPGEDEVVVKSAYAGINFTDIYRRRGDYKDSPTYQTPLPYRLGVEGGGWVEAVGAGVDALKPGDRVAFTRIHGGYAEYVVLPAFRAAKDPDGLSFKDAISVMSQGVTAHYLSRDAYPLKPGDSCLVHAAAGGVGQILVQLAKMRGARVFATVGSAEKAEIAKTRGADEVILYRDEDFREAVMAKTDGKGVNVVYDSVGKVTIMKSLNSLCIRGTCILYGHSSGLVENLPPMELAEAGSVFLTRPHLQHYVPDEAAYQARVQDLFGWLLDGSLKTSLDKVFTFETVAEAHRALANRESKGKMLIEVFGEG